MGLKICFIVCFYRVLLVVGCCALPCKYMWCVALGACGGTAVAGLYGNVLFIQMFHLEEWAKCDLWNGRGDRLFRAPGCLQM